MISEEKFLTQVFLTSDVYAACLQHALTTEKEEVMGLLIGEVDETKRISYISACVILHRSDSHPDRVEISPEQLYTASAYAEELERKLGKPLRVVGWYHSHPHITVWPSHVDVRTQCMYQMMDQFFVGLIFSVYQSDSGSIGNHVQLTCFQGMQVGSEYQRREISLQIQNTGLNKYNLESVASLSKILQQEEGQKIGDRGDHKQEILTSLHNDAFQTIALVHIVSKVTSPLCETLETRLRAVNSRTKELKRIKKALLESKEKRL